MRGKTNLSLTCLFMIIISAVGLLGCSTVFQTHQIGTPKAAQIDSHDAYRSARALGEKHEYYLEKAIQQYRVALETPETADQARYQLGLLLYQRGEFEEATAHLEQLGADFPNPFAVSKALGLCHLRMGNYAQALPLLEKASTLNPSDGEILYSIGLIYENENFAEEAKESFQRTVDLAPRTKWSEKADVHLQNLQTGSLGLKVDDIEDKEVRDLILNAPNQEDFPDAAAIILLDQEKLTIYPNKTQVREIHKVIKILNDRAHYRSEVKIRYDSLHETVQIDLARTITPDGKIVSVGKDAMRDLTPWGGFPMYSNAKVRVISMPEVVDGATIEVKATLSSSRLPFGNHFSDYFGFQDWEPMVISRFILEVPESVPFKTHFLNSPPIKAQIERVGKRQPSNAEKESNGFLRSTWERRDVPAIKWETRMPGWVNVAPLILVSSFPDWRTFDRWWWDLARSKIRSDRAIRDKAAELTRDQMTDEDKARAIYHYVASTIRYVGLEYGQGGFRPHNADDVFANKYGDCKDQAILLVTMLREVGLSAHPVLIGTAQGTWNLQRGLPMSQFDHCIALLEVDGRRVWLDPTDETCPYGELPAMDQGRQALVFFENSARFLETPVFPPEKNKTLWEIQAWLEANGTMKAKVNATFTGHAGNWRRYDFKSYSPEERIDLMEEFVFGFSPGTTLERCTFSSLDDLTVPVTVELEFTANKYAKGADDLLLFRVPHLTQAVTDFAKEDRANPLVWNATTSVETQIWVQIPEGYHVRYMPNDCEIELSSILYSQRCSTGRQTIELRALKERRTRRIDIEEYADFRSCEERIAKELNEFIIIERTGESRHLL